VRVVLCIICCAALLAACGVKRPLIAPKDIPEYERKQQEKLDKKRQFEEEQMRQQTQPVVN